MHIFMLGMSNFSKNGCVFGDVSTGVDVERARYRERR